MVKKLYFTLIILILLSLIVNLTRQIIKLWRVGSTVEKKSQELVLLESRHEELKEILKRVRDPEFIEKEAREKLGLGREGEMMVILPPLEVSVQDSTEPTRQLANWEKWWQLFFY